MRIFVVRTVGKNSSLVLALPKHLLMHCMIYVSISAFRLVFDLVFVFCLF